MKIQEPLIHVGILSAPTIQFSLEGIYIFDNKEFTGQKTVRIIDQKILFDEQMYDEVILTPTLGTCFFELTDVVIGINFHWERKENQRFNGDLKLIIEQEQLTAINRIAVENYLTSVISSEMSATASDELLKAHAVISRSWLLHPILNDNRQQTTESRQQNSHSSVVSSSLSGHIEKWYERDAHTHFDVCADDHCQRYQGITRASTEAVQKAIDATRGQVLMYDGKICDARFSKSCGGASETFENCWAPVHHPYLTKVIDNAETPEGFETDLTIEKNAENWIRKSPAAFCNTKDKNILSQVLNNYDQETTDFYRWKVEYSQEEISELIARRSGIDFGQIMDLIPIKRGESGRLIELKIVGTKQNITVGKELEIRKWLSNSHLYSSAFVVDKSDVLDGIPQHFTLTGAGWGHGVGLCQIGAAVMGEKGYRYDEILLHYFRNAELKKIYE
jgi:SpoIID/LytB domain protein